MIEKSNENLDDFKNIMFENNLVFDEKLKELSRKNELKKTNFRNLRIGTLFSGIGAFEQALEILNVPHTIEFACDNGGILLEDIMSKSEKETLELISDSQEKLEYVEKMYKKARKNNFVKQSYLANYNIPEENFYHDVRFVGSHIGKKIDILVGGSPCQSFSVAGGRGGFEDTRGTLFFEFARNVKEFQPEVFIYENVKGLTHHDKGKTFEVVLNTFEDLGYTYFYQLLNAKDYGIPQSRPRIFVIGFKNKESNFKFPEKKELKTTMAHFLQENVNEKYYLSENQTSFVRRPEKIKKKYVQLDGSVALCQKAHQQYNLQGDFVDEKYYLSDKLVQYVLNEGTKNFNIKPSIDTKIAKTLLASMHKMHRASIDNYVTGKDKRLRKLTPKECLRLMGFCDTFEQVVSDLQLYKQAGNSIVVDVLMSIILEIINTGIFDKK